MSEQEKKSSTGADSSSVVIQQSAGSRHKQPYRPIELQEPAVNLHHNRSKAPAVTSAAVCAVEEFKNVSEDPTDDTQEQKESDPAISSDKYKQNIVVNKLSSSVKRRESPEAIHVETKKTSSHSKRRESSPEPIVVKKLSSSAKLQESSPEAIHGDTKKTSSHSKRRESSPESIPLATVNVEVKKSLASQPIPIDVVSVSSGVAFDTKVKEEVGKSDEDSITEDVVELQNPEAVARHSEWSDEEEAGGLPRSESRASRVSRAVRHLLCCGMSYEAASEDNVSNTRGYSSGI